MLGARLPGAWLGHLSCPPRCSCCRCYCRCDGVAANPIRDLGAAVGTFTVLFGAHTFVEGVRPARAALGGDTGDR